MSIAKVVILLSILHMETCFKPNQKRFLDFFFNNPIFRCNCECGIPNREGRLLGGEFLQGYEFPWLVTIPIKGVTSASGVLINDQYILTAASALNGTVPFDIKATLSQYDACHPDYAITMSVDTIILHPDFNSNTGAHDLALLRLSTVAALDRRIRPICLPTVGTNYLGQVATLVSWAEGTGENGQTDATCRPRKIGLPVLGEECKSLGIFGKDNGCVGIVGGPSYLCKSDVGIPVSFRSYKGYYELIGILSDKNDCEKRPSTALYTKINENIKWILHNTRDACYCSKP